MSPDQFTFIVSFTVLAMVVLGGMGNFWGVAVGAFIDLHDQQRAAQARSTSSSTAIQMPILKDIDFIELQFLLYGLALVGDDAAAARGPVPQQPAEARAPHRR